jgi:CRISPR-associated protein Cas5d
MIPGMLLGAKKFKGVNMKTERQSKISVRLRVEGDFACFTRPEMKGERVSYDVITPSAARGILDAIYWNPDIRWVVDRIHVLNPIRFFNIRRNELKSTIFHKLAKIAGNNGKRPVERFIEKDRIQRASMILRDVVYVIDAHYALKNRRAKKDGLRHREIFNRRVRRGQCFHQPYLGCREFSAAFSPADEDSDGFTKIAGKQDLGWIIHDYNYEKSVEPVLFHALMVDGVIDVPLLKMNGATL